MSHDRRIGWRRTSLPGLKIDCVCAAFVPFSEALFECVDLFHILFIAVAVFAPRRLKWFMNGLLVNCPGMVGAIVKLG